MSTDDFQKILLKKTKILSEKKKYRIEYIKKSHLIVVLTVVFLFKSR